MTSRMRRESREDDGDAVDRDACVKGRRHGLKERERAFQTAILGNEDRDERRTGHAYTRPISPSPTQNAI